MKKLINLSLFAATCFFTASAQNNYDVKLIPAELLPHANVVKRMEEIRVEIEGPGNATIYNKYALTILNEAGDDEAGVTEGYDQFESIKNLEGTLYDANGKKIKTLKKNDVQDFSAASESTLATDARIKHHNFNWKSYPYTVEYQIATELKGIRAFPQWLPINTEKLSVEKSKLIVQCPETYGLRFKAFNYQQEPQKTTLKKGVAYEWSVEKLPAIEYEPYQPVLYQITTCVLLAPSEFEIQNYSGNMQNWQGLGKFFYELNAGRDILPADIKKQVHMLTDQLSTPREKINILYQYLQKNTHYISIQLGIGGWQTFDATYVATKAYGDCKALSNYMCALLKEAGIKANTVLVEAGNGKKSFLPDFSSDQFNHVIVCVPQQKDSVWLECTGQTEPAGYLGNFTCNRYALLIDDNGGKLVRTPVYTKDDNTQIRKVVAVVDAEGKMAASLATKYRAEQQDELELFLNAVTKEKVSDRLKEGLSLPSYDINKFDYVEEKGPIPAVNETIELTANNFATISGKRLFLFPNILNKSHSRLTQPSTRKFDIKIAPAFTDVDTVEITIPRGYTAESIPADIALDTKFGSYHANIKVKENKIFYIRYSQRNEGVYPASDAVPLADFFSKIYSADRKGLAFVKSE